MTASPLLAEVLKWIHNPTTTEELESLLRQIPEARILAFLAIEETNRSLGTLLWAELGRRRGYFEFEFLTTSTAGSLKLELKGTAAAVSEPTLRIRKPKS